MFARTSEWCLGHGCPGRCLRNCCGANSWVDTMTRQTAPATDLEAPLLDVQPPPAFDYRQHAALIGAAIRDALPQ